MDSVTLARGAVYRHVRPGLAETPSCPVCGMRRVRVHSWRHRTVEHPDPERPTYLVLQVAKYACEDAACARRYFTPPIAEGAPYARISRRLQQVAVGLYRRGKAALRDAAAGPAGVLADRDWHVERAALPPGEPGPGLPAAGAAGILRGAVHRRGLRPRRPALRQVRALGANPRVVVSDLWAAYPEALRQVWPRAERQVCWFHGMQWATRTLSALLKRHGESLPEADRRELNRLRFLLLAGPEKQAKLTERRRAALARAWALIAGTVVEEAIQLRNDLRAVLNTSTSRAEARARFDALRATWPARFRPWSWKPGDPLPEPVADEAIAGADGLRAYLEQIMAFFVRHFEAMITYLGQPGVPRTSNHVERANRRYRAVSRGRYGWKSIAGLQAMLTALQGFDSS